MFCEYNLLALLPFCILFVFPHLRSAGIVGFELGFEENNFLGHGISPPPPPPLSRPSCKNKTAINSSNRAHENTELTESERSGPSNIQILARLQGETPIENKYTSSVTNSVFSSEISGKFLSFIENLKVQTRTTEHPSCLPW